MLPGKRANRQHVNAARQSAKQLHLPTDNTQQNKQTRQRQQTTSNRQQATGNVQHTAATISGNQRQTIKWRGSQDKINRCLDSQPSQSASASGFPDFSVKCCQPVLGDFSKLHLYADPQRDAPADSAAVAVDDEQDYLPH